MEEILPSGTPTGTSRPITTKVTWRQYLETEAATRVVYLIFGFIAIAMVLAFLQFRTDAICCGDWDGYYHIRWSSLLWENFSQGKWLPTFQWLPLTVLNPQDYNDHHFLFHLLQIPFLWFFEPVMAAKVAAVTFSTFAVFSVYWLLYRYNVDYLLVWLAAILTCANMFFYRMSMAKAPALTIIITIAGIYLLFERKYLWLLPLMFAFVWTYSLFPLLLVRGDHLDDHHRVERATLRVASDSVHDAGDGDRECHQSLLPAQHLSLLEHFLDEVQGRQRLCSCGRR
jgi:hypothetical protein